MCSSFGGKGGGGRGFWYRTRTSRSAFELFWDDMAASACRDRGQLASSSSRLSRGCRSTTSSWSRATLVYAYSADSIPPLSSAQLSSDRLASLARRCPCRPSLTRHPRHARLYRSVVPSGDVIATYNRRGDVDLFALSAEHCTEVDGHSVAVRALLSNRLALSPAHSRRFEHALGHLQDSVKIHSIIPVLRQAGPSTPGTSPPPLMTPTGLSSGVASGPGAQGQAPIAHDWECAHGTAATDSDGITTTPTGAVDRTATCCRAALLRPIRYSSPFPLPKQHQHGSSLALASAEIRSRWSPSHPCAEMDSQLAAVSNAHGADRSRLSSHATFASSYWSEPFTKLGLCSCASERTCT